MCTSLILSRRANVCFLLDVKICSPIPAYKILLFLSEHLDRDILSMNLICYSSYNEFRCNFMTYGFKHCVYLRIEQYFFVTSTLTFTWSQNYICISDKCYSFELSNQKRILKNIYYRFLTNMKQQNSFKH